MKYSVFFCLAILAASSTFAGDYITGQAARAIIGQQNFTIQEQGATDRLIGAAGGVAYANGTLFIADSNMMGALPLNNRVLVYPNINSLLPGPAAYIPNYVSRCPVCTGQPDVPGAASVVMGQPDFTTTDPYVTQAGMRLPTAVASDGNIVAVADTTNNRVLIWKSIPTTNNQPADIVLGQPDFTTVQNPIPADAKSLRGPQGVWIQGGRLFVADTLDHRILIWNSIPTENDQPADVVLGQPDFTHVTAPYGPTTTDMLSPTGVSSDGTHVFVADLGFDRVLIWNEIPTQNGQSFDVELGQVDATSVVQIQTDTSSLCASNGTDSDGNPTYPARCEKTMDSPRFVLSDGQRLYVADGGNDRVLIYNSIPLQNATPADVVLGQPDFESDVVTDNSDTFDPNLEDSASDTIRTPTALAWDGTNLYVADPWDRRVLVFSPQTPSVPIQGVVNAASLAVYAVGSITVTAAPAAGDVLTLTINGTDYKYTAASGDTVGDVLNALVSLINAGSGDPYVLAIPNPVLDEITLTARQAGAAGNNISITWTASTNAQVAITVTAPTGGSSSATLAPGTLVTINAAAGQTLSDNTAQAPANADPLPFTLGGVTVYFDGIQAPLMYVSPTQINAEVPWEVLDTNSVTAWVRTVRNDGSVSVSDAVGVPIAPDNPGIFAQPGTDPRAALAYHGNSHAAMSIEVDGITTAGDIVSVVIQDRAYLYTVQAADTLDDVRDALIEEINANPAEVVTASPGIVFDRIILTAKAAGDAGNGIPIQASSINNVTNSPTVTLGASNTATCCANTGLVTQDNPAVPGEEIVIYAAGLGLVGPDAAYNALVTGGQYHGPALNTPNDFVSALADGLTANVLSSALVPGTVGLYKVVLELSTGVPTNPYAQMTIAQSIYVSNIVTIPIVAPTPPASD
jgi:hypothetical protein